ncbi:molecular chaperone HtpG [bacterium]|nr:molecular chaperone HtpG [bacterium]
MATEETRGKTRQFKAEVQHLLDIVIHSLYTDHEIFIRELISNAADALEKVRHLTLTQQDVFDRDLPLEIRIETDKESGTFAISDTGIGMTEEEASRNLGTIAHSGSREFLQTLKEGGEIDAELIGQFGVGFYSAFMVADRVTVTTRAADPEAEGVRWSSTGAGKYTVKTEEIPHRGTKIQLALKEDRKEYAESDTVKGIIKRYSNFVPFPIFVDGEQVNTVQALWTKNKNELTDEDYKGFYQFVANANDEPMYRLHFNADAPLALRAILFVPGSNFEKFGLGKMEPGVSLYCKKVLIQAEAEELLPDYLRFIKGVVDSEDLPLNISRETMQDSALIAKLKRVLTKRVIKMLAGEAEAGKETYDTFFKEFGMFLKEGAATDFENREQLSRLLRYPSSKTERDELTSLEEYVSRMPENQKEIYYISGANRTAIESGPYIEAFRDRGIEVLYGYDHADDFVFSHLREYDGKPLRSADQANIDLPETDESASDEDKPEALPEKEAGDLARWIKEKLGDAVQEVRTTKRLTRSPAALVNPDDIMTTGMQRVMQALNKEGEMSIGNMILEVNPAHPILKNLNDLREGKGDEDLADAGCRLLLDNATVTAGLTVDSRAMVERSNKMLERALAGLKAE